MHIILLGPPGAGMGRQAALLAKPDRIPHISTGYNLRAAKAAGTPLGKLAAGFMDRGDLVPDDVVIGLVKERLAQPDCQKGFIFDGFPRTVPQADALGRALTAVGVPLTGVISIEVPDGVLVDRAVGRRSCQQCGEIYHVVSKPAKTEGVCDKCGGSLLQRDDDRAEVVENRLRRYHQQTAPLIDYYRAKGLLRTVDGQQSMDAVTADIRKAV